MLQKSNKYAIIEEKAKTFRKAVKNENFIKCKQFILFQR